MPFDFTVDKAARTVFITREFNAPVSLVWDAFTKPEILDQWLAPSPYKSKTEYMDFKVGGKRFYAFVSPEGRKSWIIQQYLTITPKTNLKTANAFADKDGQSKMPGSEWDYTFSERNGKTRVNITILNYDRIERNIESNFRPRLKMTLDVLEKLLIK